MMVMVGTYFFIYIYKKKKTFQITRHGDRLFLNIFYFLFDFGSHVEKVRSFNMLLSSGYFLLGFKVFLFFFKER